MPGTGRVPWGLKAGNSFSGGEVDFSLKHDARGAERCCLGQQASLSLADVATSRRIAQGHFTHVNRNSAHAV